MELNKEFQKVEITETYFFSMFNILGINETQIKTPLRSHPAIMAKLKNQETTNASMYVGKEGWAFIHHLCKYKLLQPLWKTVWRFL